MKSIHVLLAAYRPDPGFLDAQVASLARQTDRGVRHWAVIADRTSEAEVTAAYRRHGLEVRTLMPGTSLDAVGAFGFGLAQVLALDPEAGLFAFADQDDVWHPERLSRGRTVLEKTGADLVHSDARLIDQAGQVVAPSLWRREARLRRPGLRGLLFRNTVTGMTALFTRRLAEVAVPFPEQAGVHFYHDLWLALLAEAAGGLVGLDEALVDYRQHDGNAVGALPRCGRGARAALWTRAGARQGFAEYARARYLAKALSRRVTEAEALPALRFDPARLAPLRPFLHHRATGAALLADALRLGLTGHPRDARIAARHAVMAAGRLALGLRRAAGPGLTDALRDLDAKGWTLSPGVLPVADRNDPPTAEARPRVSDWQGFVDRRTVQPWRLTRRGGPPCLTVLVPTLNPAEIFAGIATALDLALLLAARGIPVRLVATDLPIAAREATRAFLAGRCPPEANLVATMRRVEVLCGVTARDLDLHPQDRLMATAWWTAHVARSLMREARLESTTLLYLIQDYEPGFYPWGAEFAGAEASYAGPVLPIFNTTLLQDHFAALGYAWANAAMTFRPALDLGTYAGLPRSRGAGPRKLALYGRPEVPRNLFPTAVAALAGFITAEGLGPRDIEPVSVGLPHAPVALPNGVMLRSLGKLPYSAYPVFLSGVDVGLSLMLSPHPSHPPLEMAAAGARVVTNGFGPKDLSRLSPLLLSVPPTADAVAGALCRAWHAPPATAADRRLDLDQLGVPLADIATRIAETLKAEWAAASPVPVRGGGGLPRDRRAAQPQRGAIE